MTRPRAADDFAAIRARMEELRRERDPVPRPGEEPRGVGRLPDSLYGSDASRARSEREGRQERGDWSGGRPRR